MYVIRININRKTLSFILLYQQFNLTELYIKVEAYELLLKIKCYYMVKIINKAYNRKYVT